MQYDVAIIGAGMSGLAAGLRLAMFGVKVCILEKHSLWGGLNSFYKKGGHRFDTGLHAVTNYLKPGYRGPRIPMSRVLRQLRIRAEELELEPQTYSETVYPDVTLRFENGLEVLTEEIRNKFPGQVDGFLRLAERCEAYPDALTTEPPVSTRRMLTEYLSDPLLIDMLLCPLLWYGSAQEEDVDFDQFIILFNSIYREGFCRPRKGVRQILDVLVKKYREAGGEMRRNCGVERLVVEEGQVTQIELEKGEPITAKLVLSSAGRVETDALRTDVEADVSKAGQLSFVETVWVLDRPPAEVGHRACISFCNLTDRVAWRRPAQPLDVTSGILCAPSNYAHAEPLDEPVLRITQLADHRYWSQLGPRYDEEKAKWVAESEKFAKRIAGDFLPHVVYRDAFTPRTVTHYTSRINGAIYGSPEKLKNGDTGVDNLKLIGTDQGLVGIIGAMLSGIAMANHWGLS